MRKSYSIIIFIITIIISSVSAQTEGIKSGAIYSIKSVLNNKLLNVTNSSMDYNANIDCWSETGSDSQRWIVTNVSDSTYTFVNVASEKYLHMTGFPANNINVNQYPYTSYIKWNIIKNTDGAYFIKANTNNKYVLTIQNSGLTDGTNVNLLQILDNDSQKWTFQEEEMKESAPTATIADDIFNSWKINYYYTRTGNEVIKGEGFWGVAEMMEIVDDAYEVTGNSKYKTLFSQMYNQFLIREGSDWMWNEYNDDITWMAIACTRAGLLTGIQSYINKAKEQFDKMYSRASTDLYGGGLIWKEGTNTKNACINGPAMVACCYLAQATGDETYYQKAIDIYNWSKIYLFNPSTGKVNDAYDGVIHNWSSTYNQGTYLGAAMMLYNYTKDPAYLQDATNIAKFTRYTMYSQKVMNNEEGPDLSGFKGIFMRYARRYTVDGNKTDLIPWLKLNATVAYNNRNSKNIISTLWGTKATETDAITAFSASTAVSLLINCPLSTNIVRNAYDSIQAENFDYIKGINTETCTEGTLNITNLLNNYYTAYYNVDFGENGADSIRLRVSAIADGGTIEIRTGNIDGALIGTATVKNTGSWSNYSTIACPVNQIKGLQNIYLVFKGGGNICKINYFSFVENISSGFSNVNNLKIKIYPNPAKEKINVNTKGLNVNSISIKNTVGRSVYENDQINSLQTIDVSGLIRGVYFLTIQTINNEQFVRKFIK